MNISEWKPTASRIAAATVTTVLFPFLLAWMIWACWTHADNAPGVCIVLAIDVVLGFAMHQLVGESREAAKKG